jgi:ElaB/YqjD/DUF883 family membrane-anchored ribosome-binding protein
MYTKDHTKNMGHHSHDIQHDFQRVKDKARETRDAISQTAYDVKGRAQDILAQSLRDAKERSSDAQDTVVTYVKTNPVKSVGYAIIAGLFVALLLRK